MNMRSRLFEQMPAAYRFKVGEFECTVVSDGPLRLGTFNAELFKGLTQGRIDAFVAANFLDKDNFVIDQNALVVDTGGKLVLIDTGMGFRKIYGPRTGHLLANLRAAGIEPQVNRCSGVKSRPSGPCLGTRR